MTGLADGSCFIRVILSKNNYRNLNYSYNFTVQAGTQTASWTPGANSGTVGTRLTLNAVTGASGATVTYPSPMPALPVAVSPGAD